jgi:hypothetical protein
LIEASFKASDLELLERAIGRLQEFDSNDAQLATALFSRAVLLKKEGRTQDASEQLKALLGSDFPEKPSAYFELVQLEALELNWPAVQEYAMTLLNQYPQSDLVPFAWNFAAQSTLELKQHEAMQELLNRCPSDKADWEYRLAKLEFDSEQFAKAADRLKTLPAFSADGELLLALCHQRLGAEEEFCKWAELALTHQASAIGVAEQHLALFNSYLARSQLEPAAYHLYSAFTAKAQIQQPNLLWLANFAFDRGEWEKAYAVLLQTETQETEVLLKLAQLHFRFGAEAEAIAILEKIDTVEGKLALAEALMTTDLVRAETLFDEVAASDTLRESWSAKAALESARLKRSRGEYETVALLLKNLTLQKNIENEPVYLEAALDYVDLQTEPSKRVAILKKMKALFESQEDILSKDYHAAREKLAEQNRIYLAYMDYFDAQDLLLEAECNMDQQMELQTKARQILLQISCNEGSPLSCRIKQRLLELEYKAK